MVINLVSANIKMMRYTSLSENMTYKQAIDRINELGRFGINLGLGRIEKLLENMGNPEKKLKIIHIGGTNGKGSVSTMLMSILAENGYKAGLFTSPFIVDFREGMQINGEMISKELLAQCSEFVLSHWEKSKVNGEFPTQFEVMTAIAFEWFWRSECDFICLEVGMGGKGDSTNVIPPPVLQILTSISLDHMGILGSTIEEIAIEKSGIVKGGITVAYPCVDKNVVEIISKRCIDTGSELVQPVLEKLEIVSNDWRHTNFKYRGVEYTKKLYGEFQIYNAVTAIESAFQLRRLGFIINDEAILKGVANASLPARMEVLQEKPLIILDGSHNVGGVNALLVTLEQLKNRNITILMGVLADKEYETIVSTVARYAKRFIAVEPNNPRKLDCEKLADLASSYCSNVSFYKNHEEAVKIACDCLEDDDILIACGSLYLAGDIRSLMC